MRSASVGTEFVLNGETVRKNGIAPQVTLLDYIRGRGLTGAKEGCAEPALDSECSRKVCRLT
jgi:xanthine dehydrogenase iron-sulfur cluster and FAD-binding subunit A